MKNCIPLNIAYLVSKTKLSKDAFGRLFGLNRGTVSSYISGKAQPKSDTMRKISAYFGISINDIMNIDLEHQQSDNIASTKYNINNEQYNSIFNRGEYSIDLLDMLWIQIRERDKTIAIKDKIIQEKDEQIRSLIAQQNKDSH